jgi:hypothetical protein
MVVAEGGEMLILVFSFGFLVFSYGKELREIFSDTAVFS